MDSKRTFLGYPTGEWAAALILAPIILASYYWALSWALDTLGRGWLAVLVLALAWLVFMVRCICGLLASLSGLFAGRP